MSLKETQNFFSRLCFDPDFSVDDSHLAKILSQESREHILKQDPKRQVLYRRLVTKTLTDGIRNAFSEFFEKLGPEKTKTTLKAFLQTPISSPHYRHIPYEFFDFLKSRELGISEELLELADYEFCHYELQFRENETSSFETDPDLDLAEARLVFNPHLVLRDYKKLKLKQTLIYRNPESLTIHDFTLSESCFIFLKIFLENPSWNFNQGALAVVDTALKRGFTIGVEEILAYLKDLLEKKIVLALLPSGA